MSWDPVPGSYGYLVEYRLSSESTWTTPSIPANPTFFTSYDLILETNSVYYLRLSSAGTNCASTYTLYTLSTYAGNCCSVGYTLSSDETYCYKIETTAPTIIQSNICLASSQLATTYSGLGTRLYSSGYTTTLVGAYSTLSTSPQWIEPSGNTIGPMNREGVWVDTDCSGTIDPLTAGQAFIITIPITATEAKTVYVGISGDNTFRLDVNGTTIVDRDSSFGNLNFYYWHIVPVDILSGTTYFTFKWVGDGSVNDSAAAVIYNNTDVEISAATSDATLNLLFRTSTYLGSHIDIATCPSTYFLDTAGGSGNYDCKKLTLASTVAC